MPDPSVIDISHDLGRDEARKRLRERISQLPGHIPGGVADVKANWLDENRMALAVTAMGQTVSGTVEVHDRFLRLSFVLPPLLSFMSGMITSAIRREGSKLLLGDHRKD